MAKAVTTTLPELLVDGDDAKFRQLIYNILAFSARLDAVRNGLGALIGLTGPQYSVLITIRMLEGKGGSTGVVDVADYLHVSGAFVTSEVNKLIRLGLVAKAADTEDRRRVRLSVTSKGEARLTELSLSQVPVNDILFSDITREQFDVLCEVFPKLVIQGEASLHELEYLLRKADRGSRVS